MKTMIIINPASKKGRNVQLRQTVERKLASLSPVTRITRYAGEATLLASHAARDGYGTIVAVGGDGAVNEVLNGIIGTDITLGIIPAGTANDVASNYGIPIDTEQACEVVLNGKIHQPDVISVNDWYYLTVGGIGLPCNTLAIAESLKRKDRFGKLMALSLGSRIYLLALICALMKQRWGTMQLRVTGGQVTHSGATLSLIVGNQSRLGGHFQALPTAKDDDGMMDVFVLRKHRRCLTSLVTLSKTTLGTHGDRPDVKLFRTDRLEIETNHAVPFFGDGRIGTTGRRFTVHILPNAARLIVPLSKEVC